jgi:hypothetical protein
MILGQSAATAATFAIDENIPVQNINYEKLKISLLPAAKFSFGEPIQAVLLA